MEEDEKRRFCLRQRFLHLGGCPLFLQHYAIGRTANSSSTPSFIHAQEFHYLTLWFHLVIEPGASRSSIRHSPLTYSLTVDTIWDIIY